LSADQLRDEAEAAATRVEENQKIVEEESNKMESANDATNAISEIQSKLTGSGSTASGRLQQREKRQAETTVAPVDAPKNCTEFDTLYINLLSMAAAVTDSNIFQIKAIVIVLRPIEPDTLCSSAEKSALATKAQADVDKAVAKTKEYAGQKKDIVEQKKVEINKDLAIQQNANQQLEEREEPTVPTKQSTYKVEATQPIGGGNNEATTQPAGGDGGSNEATTKPAVGNNELTTKPAGGNMEATTKPAGGNMESPTGAAGGNLEPTTEPAGSNIAATSKPAGGNMEATTKPAGGNMESTPGAAGGNMESTTKPAGSNIEATSQPAGQTQAMSTVKPGRRIFDSVNKRSRGSIKRS